MKSETNGHLRVPVNNKGDSPAYEPADRHVFLTPVARAGALGLLFISFFVESSPRKATAPPSYASSSASRWAQSIT